MPTVPGGQALLGAWGLAEPVGHTYLRTQHSFGTGPGGKLWALQKYWGEAAGEKPTATWLSTNNAQLK